jgi:hypothetical protein
MNGLSGPCWRIHQRCDKLGALPLPIWGEGGGEGVTDRPKPQPLTPPLSHPNSGLPEFGILKRPKSDGSDFGWERA